MDFKFIHEPTFSSIFTDSQLLIVLYLFDVVINSLQIAFLLPNVGIFFVLFM